MQLERRAAPGRALDADRRRLAERDGDAELLGERRLDDLLLDLAVERDAPARRCVVVPDADQRVLLGELVERDVQRAPVGRRRAGRRRSRASAGRSACASGAAGAPRRARRRCGRPPRPARACRSAPARAPARGGDRAAARTRSMRRHLAPSPAAERPGRARAARPSASARRRASRPPAPRSILNTVPATGPSGVAARRAGSSSVSAASSASTPAPVIARSRGTRDAPRPPRSAPRAPPRSRSRPAPRRPRRTPRAARRRARRAPRRAAVAPPARPRRGLSRVRDLASSDARPGRAPRAVELVDEDQRRHAQPLQRAHQHARLRLHALDRRDDQHGAVEHAQHALHLGDEVGVAGRVDQVDGDVADRERDDRGLDRDAAPALERERVGLRVAVVDAAELVDDAGGVEQPLGEGGLTGVDVRQDPQVQGTALRVMSSARIGVVGMDMRALTTAPSGRVGLLAGVQQIGARRVSRGAARRARPAARRRRGCRSRRSARRSR